MGEKVAQRPSRQRPSPRPVVAAIDCGTNTIKLLIGALPEVAVREMRMVRLGEGVDRTGELAPRPRWSGRSPRSTSTPR